MNTKVVQINKKGEREKIDHEHKDSKNNRNDANNGTVCTVKRDGRSGGMKMIAFTEKLTN